MRCMRESDEPAGTSASDVKTHAERIRPAAGEVPMLRTQSEPLPFSVVSCSGRVNSLFGFKISLFLCAGNSRVSGRNPARDESRQTVSAATKSFSACLFVQSAQGVPTFYSRGLREPSEFLARNPSGSPIDDSWQQYFLPRMTLRNCSTEFMLGRDLPVSG
jgi:hypothetical protein